MIESFERTSVMSDLLFLVDSDDPCLHAYFKLFGEHKHLVNFIKKTTTQMINHAFDIYDKYDYYSVTNDDFIYHTNEWDRILCDKIESKGGWGIAYGEDGTKSKVPTTNVISANIVRSLGWLQLPLLEHLCGDIVWKEIGQSMNFLYYVPQVKIEHVHYMQKKCEMDDIAKKTNADEMYKNDWENVRIWRTFQKKKHLEMIKCARSAS